MLIATTGEMPVNYADVVDCDLARAARTGLTDRAASQLDQFTLRLRRALQLSILAENQWLELEPWFDIESASDWHQEPDFIPGKTLRGILLGPPDFSDVTDGIDWE